MCSASCRTVPFEVASNCITTGCCPPGVNKITIAEGGTNSNTALTNSSIMISNGTGIVQGATGTATQVLHGNGSSAPTYSAVSLTADVTGVLPTANIASTLSNKTLSGTVSIANPTFTGLSDAVGGYTNMAVLSGGQLVNRDLSQGVNKLTIGEGGTNSISALTNSSIMISNGSAIIQGATGTTTQVLHGNGSSAPTYSAVSLTADVSGTLPIARGGSNSGTALSGNSIMISNGSAIVQGSAGTTTTVLHGNASGSPSYSAVSLSADWTGTLPVGNGGSGQTSYTNGQLLIGNSTGSTLTKATLTEGYGIDVTNSTGSISLAITQKAWTIRDLKANNTQGGTNTINTWVQRTLNTIAGTTSDTSCTLASNEITLTAGVYHIYGTVPGYACGDHATRFWNITSSGVSIYGTNEVAPAGVQSRSIINQVLTVGSTTAFKIEHYCKATTGTSDFGIATNVGSSDVYCDFIITRLA